MTLFSTAQHLARDSRRDPRGHLVPIALAGLFTAGAVALVAYLLWPTWDAEASSSSPARLPVSIGSTLFNVPTMAVRMKIQRHSGPQERVDLAFTFPALEAPDTPRHISAGAGNAGAHHLSALPGAGVDTRTGRADGARIPGRHALRQRGSVFCQHAQPHRALHARWRNPRHVPERAPHRRRRP